MVWGFNIFLSFSFRAINCLLQTLNSLTKLGQRNKVECNDQEIPFVFFSLSSFCWMCAELYEVIHLYASRNIGFAILDQPIGPSMLYSHSLWHRMIHEAPEESKLPHLPSPPHTRQRVNCAIYGVEVLAAQAGTIWMEYGFKDVYTGQTLHQLRTNLGSSYF